MQEAVAIGLKKSGEHDFFPKQLAAYIERRDILTSYFDKLQLSYTKPEGSYFLLVDMSRVKVPEGFVVPPSCKGRGKDFELCWWLAQEIKVVAIPPSEVSASSTGRGHTEAIQFYCEEHASVGERFARFAFVSPWIQIAVVLVLILTSARTRHCCMLQGIGCSGSRSSWYKE